MLLAVDDFINSNDSQEKKTNMLLWHVQVINLSGSLSCFFFSCTVCDKSPRELGYQATSCCWLHLTISNIGHSLHSKSLHSVAYSILVILFHIRSSMNISYCQWMSYWMTSIKTHKCWEQARVYKLALLISACFDWVQSNHPVEGKFLEDLF